MIHMECDKNKTKKSSILIWNIYKIFVSSCILSFICFVSSTKILLIVDIM